MTAITTILDRWQRERQIHHAQRPPGTYTLHALPTGCWVNLPSPTLLLKRAAGELGQAGLEASAHGKQVWEIGYPTAPAASFTRATAANYWLWGWCVPLSAPVPERHHLHYR